MVVVFLGGNTQMEILIAILLINKQLGNLVINFIMDMMSFVCFMSYNINKMYKSSCMSGTAKNFVHCCVMTCYTTFRVI